MKQLICCKLDRGQVLGKLVVYFESAVMHSIQTDSSATSNLDCAWRITVAEIFGRYPV